MRIAPAIEARFGLWIVCGTLAASIACDGGETSGDGVAADRAGPKGSAAEVASKPQGTMEPASEAETAVERETEAKPEPAVKPEPEVKPGADFNPVGALAKVHKVKTLEPSDESLGEMMEPVPNSGVFKAGERSVGAAWYRVSLADAELAVLASTELESDQYEFLFTSLSTFVHEGGEWKHVHTSAAWEDDGSEYAVVPQLVELGGGHFALLHAPAIAGCGAEPCAPEDDFVDNTLFELRPAGVREVWRFKGPACGVDQHPVNPAGCTVEVMKASEGARGELLVHAQLGPKDRGERRFAWKGERYALE